MKRFLFLFTAFTLLTFPIFSEDTRIIKEEVTLEVTQKFTQETTQIVTEDVEQDSTEDLEQPPSDEESTILNAKTGFPEITEKPFLMFNEGVAFSHIARHISQKDKNRSDFIWREFMLGIYCEMQTGNMRPFNSIVRVGIYYPFGHSFNEMSQISKQILIYDFDIFAGILFQTDMWKYLRFDLAVGPHFDYELTDEFHHVELGLGALLGMELPVAWHWTVLINGLVSIDSGNLGSNAKIMPYDLVYQTQFEIGIRYSKKGANKFSYIDSKKRAALMAR